jgi:hypothetical protein
LEGAEVWLGVEVLHGRVDVSIVEDVVVFGTWILLLRALADADLRVGAGSSSEWLVLTERRVW